MHIYSKIMCTVTDIHWQSTSLNQGRGSVVLCGRLEPRLKNSTEKEYVEWRLDVQERLGELSRS